MNLKYTKNIIPACRSSILLSKYTPTRIAGAINTCETAGLAMALKTLMPFMQYENYQRRRGYFPKKYLKKNGYA